MSSGQEEFNNFYSEIYKQRWEALKKSLLFEEKQVRRQNTFIKLDTSAPLKMEALEGWLLHSEWHLNKEEITRSEMGLLDYYILDPASVLCAEMLDVLPGQRVLDMCAAPGGKSLILAQNLFSEKHSESELVLNELSLSRRERLIKVVQNYISKEARPQVWVKGQDAALFCLKNKDSFDRILLDAPCSGERHLLQNKKELDGWKKSRTMHLAQKQYSLISGASLALRPHGKMIYSTCSISPFENDMLIEKFMNKKGSNFRVIDLVLEHEKLFSNPYLAQYFEKTKYGIIFLPDRCNFGPLYFSLLQKIIA